jgi:hypothetical protein
LRLISQGQSSKILSHFLNKSLLERELMRYHSDADCPQFTDFAQQQSTIMGQSSEPIRALLVPFPFRNLSSQSERALPMVWPALHSARIAAFSLSSDETNGRAFAGSVLTWAEDGADSIACHLDDGAKGRVTVIAAITAQGTNLPITVIGKRKRQYFLAGSQFLSLVNQTCRVGMDQY